MPALDSLERAFTVLPDTLRALTWIDGVALVHLQLRNALQTLGIQPIAAEPGQPFDPQRHEAIGEVVSAEHPVGYIAAVVQRGYALNGMPLRPALVQLARAPDTASPAEDTAAPTPAGASAGEDAALPSAGSAASAGAGAPGAPPPGGSGP